MDTLAVIKKKPLQAGKFVSILLTLVLGIGGFFRVINARAILNDPFLGDGQLLALILIPLLSLGLVVIVFVESLYSGYQIVRSGGSLSGQATGRVGYVLIRGAEAVIAKQSSLLLEWVSYSLHFRFCLLSLHLLLLASGSCSFLWRSDSEFYL